MPTLRIARSEDADALLAIYAPYVERTAITFEYEVPTLNEFRERIRHTLARYPYLVLEKKGAILGYAYASPFKPRAAYSWDTELSIYLDQEKRGKGYGALLYKSLEFALKMQGILNLNACIAYPPKEDEYLTRGSVRFHKHMGFSKAGHFHKCGYKFDRWYDMVWMEKSIGSHKHGQPAPRAFPDVQDAIEEMLSGKK